MERLQSKIEGKGNGIKTVVANLTSVSNSLARPPSCKITHLLKLITQLTLIVDIIKYFGFELGAQTTNNPNDDRWIINGAHDAAKLQDYLDGFINKFVLCKKCKNPETDVNIKDGRIFLDCKACGQRSEADPRHKLSSFILKNQPKKGKKDKSTKKAERKARKEAEANGDHDDENGNGSGSLGESASDHADENGDVELDAGSDDELTRRIAAEAKEIDEPTNTKVEWSVDTSEAAVKARQNELPDELKRTLVISNGGAPLGNGDGDDDDAGANTSYDQLGSWIVSTASEAGGVAHVSDVDIYRKAQELGIERKHRTLTVLAQTIFDDGIVKQIPARAGMLRKMIDGSDKHQKALLGGTERFVGIEKPGLVPQVSAILMKYYDEDVVTEEVLRSWGTKASKKYVDLATSKKVRKSAEKFMEWLENAESDDEDEDDE